MTDTQIQELLNQEASKDKAVIASTSPINVTLYDHKGASILSPHRGVQSFMNQPLTLLSEV